MNFKLKIEKTLGVREMKFFSRRLLIGALMLFLVTSACNYPAGTSQTPVGTILASTKQVTRTATVFPTETLIGDTPTAGIPITGMNLVSLQCQFCVNDDTHAVLIMPQAASFLVSQPVTGVNCLTAQVVNGQRIVVCHGKQASFTLNVCINGSDCITLPVALQKCPLVPQTGGSTIAPTATVTAVIQQPTDTTIPPTVVAPTQVPTQVPTQTTAAPPPSVVPTAPHAEPTRSSRIPVPPAGNGIQDPAAFIRWYFAAVTENRNYQDLWNNYLTPSFKTVVSPGGFSEYVTWWDSVQRVDVNSVNVIQNDGTHAVVRVNVTFTMKDGRLISNQEYDYDLLYDAARQVWMFDVNR
jgi:hypothetical protein